MLSGTRFCYLHFNFTRRLTSSTAFILFQKQISSNILFPHSTLSSNQSKMAPVSKTSDTPNSAVNRSTNSENQTPASASSDQGGQANSATRSISNSSPFVAPRSRWFNTNILGKAVDAFQEDDLLQVMKTFGKSWK